MKELLQYNQVGSSAIIYADNFLDSKKGSFIVDQLETFSSTQPDLYVAIHNQALYEENPWHYRAGAAVGSLISPIEDISRITREDIRRFWHDINDMNETTESLINALEEINEEFDTLADQAFNLVEKSDLRLTHNRAQRIDPDSTYWDPIARRESFNRGMIDLMFPVLSKVEEEMLARIYFPQPSFWKTVKNKLHIHRTWHS